MTEARSKVLAHRTESAVQPAPFNLIGVILTSAFCSVLCGGLLTALNWQILGKPQRFWPSVVSSALAVAVFSSVSAALPVWLGIPHDTRLLIVSLAGLNVVGGLLLAAWQYQAHRQWLTEHPLPKRGLRQVRWRTYTRTMVASVIVGYLGAPKMGQKLVALGSALRPAQTFQGGNVTLTYPGNWYTVDRQSWNSDLKALCEDTQTQCLLEADFAAGDGSLLVIRFTGAFIELYSAAQIDAAVWPRLQQTQGARLISLQTLTVDGQPAVERIFTVPSGHGGTTVQMLTFIKERSGAILRLEVEASDEDTFNRHQREIEATLASLHVALVMNSQPLSGAVSINPDLARTLTKWGIGLPVYHFSNILLVYRLC